MKQITAYETSDGRIHTDHRTAQRHADERYGAELIKHARAIAASNGKYTTILQYLDDNADSLTQLEALKNDRDIVETDE